jgi:hypothetical protein
VRALCRVWRPRSGVSRLALRNGFRMAPVASASCASPPGCWRTALTHWPGSTSSAAGALALLLVAALLVLVLVLVLKPVILVLALLVLALLELALVVLVMLAVLLLVLSLPMGVAALRLPLRLVGARAGRRWRRQALSCSIGYVWPPSPSSGSSPTTSDSQRPDS